MRVVLLITDLAIGGAEWQVAQLAMRLRQRGWNISVISLVRPSAWTEELAAADVPVYSLDMQPGGRDPVALLRMARLLRKLQPHILHAHLFHANVLARLMRIVFPIPVVLSTLHSLAETSRRSGLVRGRDRVYRFTDWLADATIAVCETAAVRHRAAHAVSPRRSRVIPNGVDTAQFHPYAAHRATVRKELGLGNRFTWLAVGRLMWKKDFPTLLEAFTLVSDATLLIAGDGEQREKLERTAEDLRIDVRFLGARADVGELMNGCDAFVLSSVIEGLPIVLLEAAASGLPCVATNVGGVPEVIVDGRTGFIVPPGEPRQLGDAMSVLMRLSPAERARMGKAARKRAVTKFDWSVVIPRWESLYRELLDAARVAAREPAP